MLIDKYQINLKNIILEVEFYSNYLSITQATLGEII